MRSAPSIHLLLAVLLLWPVASFGAATASSSSSSVLKSSSEWRVFDGQNAVPSSHEGKLYGTTSSSLACESACTSTHNCSIFTWNSRSGHCFLRFDGIWAPEGDNTHVQSGCEPSKVASCPAAPPTPPHQSLPLLFLDKSDGYNLKGRIEAKASSAQRAVELATPPLNYTGGATVIAAFDLGADGYEFFAAVGRPGEPIYNSNYNGSSVIATATVHKSNSKHSTTDNEKDIYGSDGSSSISNLQPDGVSVLRFTTQDLRTYSTPTRVLFLENGSGDQAAGGLGDGAVWTVKSMDRDVPAGQPTTKGVKYVMFASYGSSAHTFVSTDILTADSFTPTTGDLKKGNFKDHDDCNIFYDQERKVWIDMQIMYQKWNKTYCDNVKGARRVVSVRNSTDGKTWSDDWGCLDNPQTSEHCSTFNLTAMVHPGPSDPPELEFYRIRPFIASGRLMAHVLLYVPAPSTIVLQPGYGRQPLWYCTSGCCHGPHMYEEWWIGPNSGDPTDMSAWRRPYFDTRAFPHDVWAMEQPVLYNHSYVWVDNGNAWQVPEFRFAGLNSLSNGEFSTAAFTWPSSGAPLYLEADAYWGQKQDIFGPEWCRGGCNGVGGSDEGHAAYIMVEALDAATGATLPGYEREKCIFLNKGGQLPLRWANASTTSTSLAGKDVVLRIYFREATIFAIHA